MADALVELQRLARTASPVAVKLALTVLDQDVSDQLWAAQIGPALRQSDVAALLGKSEQAVSKDARLLRIRNRDGRPVYPVMQFDGRRQVPGVAQVVEALAALDELTVASWLTGRARKGQSRPIDRLTAGEVEPVVAEARRLAVAAS